MRHSFFVLAASMFLAAFAGCACNTCGQCNSCQGKAAAAAAHHQPQQTGPGGVVTYPYYTLRGPRDFLEAHPQSIGP